MELERHMKMLEADMLKLNTLLSQNSQLSQALEQGNVLMETDFLHRLKVGQPAGGGVCACLWMGMRGERGQGVCMWVGVYRGELCVLSD